MILDLLKKKNKPSDIIKTKLKQMGGEITYTYSTKTKPAENDKLPNIETKLKNTLKSLGIKELYTHQTKAANYAISGKNIIIATPTASGKTLCYNIPTLNSIIKDSNAKALYLFPTKALAQDQLKELQTLINETNEEITVNTYDGDTPKDKRYYIREKTNIIITNPDMLHAAILPCHDKWVKFISNLQYIVIDELHSYKGTFGSHMANLLARLDRICALYGAHPTYICASATIANPKEHAEALTGKEMLLITENGAPSPEKELIIYNPPYIIKKANIRKSSALEVAELATETISQNISTIIFTTSRKNVETLLKLIKEKLITRGENPKKVTGYRAGYLINERRQIEQKLKNGEITGVVSTNALELGIDIGALEIAILHGYPGSIASTQQQIGRAGRRDTKTTAVIIASATPIDQYLAHNPTHLTSAPSETARINPTNPYIMVKHIKCAIKEKPFIKGEKFANNNITQILEYYALNNIVKKETTGDTTTYKWNGTTYPASEISLRNATDATYTIQQREQTEKIGQNIKTKIIGTVDKHYAHTMLYPNAIYTHMGKNYIVTQLDTEHKKCTVTETTTRQYTETISSSSVTITKEIEKSQNIGWGKSIITTTPFMYITKEINTHKKTGQGKIQTPKEETKTTSAWIILPEEIINRRDGIETADAIKSLLQNIIPLYLMCDTKDIEIHEETEKLTNGRFAIYISDTIPGGIGLAEGTYQSCNKILKSCMELLKTCKCQNGCPLCIGAPEADSTPNMKMQTYKTIKQIIEGK